MNGSLARLAPALLSVCALTATLTASAQNKPQAKNRRAHHETNASRQSRIARTIEDTYSHAWEIYGGGGYLRWDAGQYLQRNNEVTWDTTVSRFLTPRLAIIGDARGAFGRAYALRFQGYEQITRPQINEYFFTGGASYRFLRREHLALSAAGTGGAVWGMFSGGAAGLTGPDLGTWNDGIRPAFTVNLNADYNVYPNLGVRFSPTWVGTNFDGKVQSNFGFNTGILYRFGRQGHL